MNISGGMLELWIFFGESSQNWIIYFIVAFLRGVIYIQFKGFLLRTVAELEYFCT